MGHTRAAPTRLLLACCCLLAVGQASAARRLLGEEAAAKALQEGQPVRVGVWLEEFPVAYVEDGEITGFGPELARAVCGHAGLECELVPIAALDDRIPSLQNGTVDALFASLAVTPERAELVDYLRPFYDAYDLTLVALEGKADELEAAGGFAGLAGTKLCVLTGDAVAQTVEKLNAIVVEAPSFIDIVDKLVAGDCDAVIDGGLELENAALERANATLVALPNTAPIAPGAGAAAVAKGQAGSELGLRLTAGLVAAMSKGDDSDLLKLEQEFLIANGATKNAVLHRLVEMLTDLGVSSGKQA